MNKYIETTEIQVKPMTLGEYNQEKNRSFCLINSIIKSGEYDYLRDLNFKLEDETLNDDGYLIINQNALA